MGFGLDVSQSGQVIAEPIVMEWLYQLLSGF